MASFPSVKNAKVQQSITDEDAKERVRRSCREIISTLPTEKGWRKDYSWCQYQGFWCPAIVVEGIMWAQQNFKARNEDVLLVSFPKCGTTWLKSLVFAIMNRTRYDFSAHPLLTSSPHELVPFLEFYLQQNSPFPDFDILSSPQLFHTHIPFTSLPQPVIDSQCRIVYICRNPKDVFVSTFCFIPERDLSTSLEDAFDEFCKGISIYGPIWDHMLGYWKASLVSPHRILFMKYEDVKRDSSRQVKRLAEFLGCPFSSEEEGQGSMHDIIELCSFGNLSNLKANKTGALRMGSISFARDSFFRKGEIGDWKNHLTAEMANRLDRIVEEKLNGSGLTFKDSSE